MIPVPVDQNTTLLLAHPPYHHLEPVKEGLFQLKLEGRTPGSVLVWRPTSHVSEDDIGLVSSRPGGLSLVILLPSPATLPDERTMARLVEITRPHAVLPYQEELPSASLRQALARPPLDLAAAVTDYLAWRGIPTDQETRRLIRKIVDLSADLRSVSGLSRHLYLSRRALGRRFLTNGLPVPSHWLHFARLLRAALQIQNTDDSVVSVAYGLGYPDGFSLSNQMYRLTGHRPQTVRTCLGWEWIIEAWLRREADRGGLAPEFTQGILAGEMVQVQSALDRESEDRVAG